MIKIPYDCPRGRSDCIALAKIEADEGKSFFCCGENNGEVGPIKGDTYTVCFKGEHDDRMAFFDNRDLTHQAAVLAQTLAAVQASYGDKQDWSPWREFHGAEPPERNIIDE